MSENVYVLGEIWEDKDGDEWEVQEDGTLFFGPLDWYRTPEHVETRWGPLALKRRAEGSDAPLTDWEKQILAEAGHPKFQPESEFKLHPDVPKNAFYPAPGNNAGTFQIGLDILDRLDSVFVGHAIGVYEEALELLLKKNADYGSKNIAQSPGGPLNGLRVRMWDKMARINNLMDSGVEPENESLRDSFVDLLNYSAIALMVLDGKWPGTEDKG